MKKKIYRLGLCLLTMLLLSPLLVKAYDANNPKNWDTVKYWCDYRVNAYVAGTDSLLSYFGFDMTIVYFDGVANIYVDQGHDGFVGYDPSSSNSTVNIYTDCSDSTGTCKKNNWHTSAFYMPSSADILNKSKDANGNYKCPTIYSEYDENTGTRPDHSIKLKLGTASESGDQGQIYEDGFYTNQSKFIKDKAGNVDNPTSTQQTYSKQLNYSCGINSIPTPLYFDFNKNSDGTKELCVQVYTGGKSCMPVTNSDVEIQKTNGEFENFNFKLKKDQISKLFLSDKFTSSDVYIAITNFKEEDVENNSLKKKFYTIEITTDLEYAKNYQYSKTGTSNSSCNDMNISTNVSNNVNIGDGYAKEENFIGNLSCGGTEFQFHKSLPNFTNIIFDLLKIGTPIIIIITGMIDMLKAVSAQKEDEIKKSQQKLLRRLLAGAVVFLVFVIVQTVIHTFAENEEAENAWDCVDCFLIDSDSCTEN